ncbi:hypothetical protein [Alistipes putredinis]|uniref:hypothetical protein n=1 Tax=Alistipes putredinis TaxID=28117 RepID=UPI003991D247
MTYPLQENADGVFANRILQPEPEMQAIFTEIGLRTCGRRRLSPACRLALPPPAGKSRRQRRTFYLTRNRIYSGIARQIKSPRTSFSGLFAYRLAERRDLNPETL